MLDSRGATVTQLCTHRTSEPVSFQSKDTRILAAPLGVSSYDKCDQIGVDDGRAPLTTSITSSCDLMDPHAVTHVAARIAGSGWMNVLIASPGGDFGRARADLQPGSRQRARRLRGQRAASKAPDRGVAGPPHRTGHAHRGHELDRRIGREQLVRGVERSRDASALWTAGRLDADGITVNVVARGFVPGTDFWRARLETRFRRATKVPCSAEAEQGTCATASGSDRSGSRRRFRQRRLTLAGCGAQPMP